jgi:hypothetical protein
MQVRRVDEQGRLGDLQLEGDRVGLLLEDV